MINCEEITVYSTVSQREGNVTSDMAGEKVMFNVDKGKYYNLGSIGGEIWGELKDPIRVSNLIDILIEKFEVSRDVCEDEVIRFLTMLDSEELLNKHN
ncbi:lasso peptide biosynthesis PqqD family chaperone [Metabacillus sp. 84]|uniref:lasso peptide biosynthesis PqqD family chaperone n=1 Tax=Metabacillus sp. 84 TaxID=3404705 RepID=UPI003CF1BDFD